MLKKVKKDIKRFLARTFYLKIPEFLIRVFDFIKEHNI